KSIGRTILSATVDTPPQITTTSKALPQWPLNPSHNAAGPQINAEPTTGTSEKNAINTPQKTGVESPVNANEAPPSSPWITATSNPTATLAKINSFDSSSMSVWMSSSNGSRCFNPRTMSSPSRNIKNKAKIKMNKSTKKVTMFFSKLPNAAPRNAAIFCAACSNGSDTSIARHDSGSRIRIHSSALKINPSL